MALVTIDDLAAYVQQDIPTATGTLAIEGASDIVTSYCRQSFEAVSGAVKTLLAAQGGYVAKLPQGPVTDVTAVVDEDGDAVDYRWDSVSAQIFFTYRQVAVTVTYDHGRDDVPAAVKLVVLSVAARAYANPTSLRTEFIADYQSTNFFGAIDLSKAEKNVLNRYRSGVLGTVTPK